MALGTPTQVASTAASVATARLVEHARSHSPFDRNSWTQRKENDGGGKLKNFAELKAIGSIMTTGRTNQRHATVSTTDRQTRRDEVAASESVLMGVDCKCLSSRLATLATK